MSPREAFKEGFARRCAEEGLTPEQVDARIEKAASIWSNLVQNHGTQLALGAPLALGAAGGYAAHHLTSNDIDEEDVRKQELIDELRQWTRRAKEQQKSKALRLTPM